MQSDTIKNKLRKSGLTEKEAAIYTYLIENNGGYPTNIAEATKINRSTTYKILLQLSIKGLVNEIKKSKKIFYQVEDPRNLLRFTKSNVRIAKQNLESAESILANLQGLYNNGASKPEVRYFQGKDGVAKIYEEQINNSKPYEMLAVTHIPFLTATLDKDFFVTYRKAKESKKITTRGILPDTSENRLFIKNGYKELGINKKYYPNVRFAPATFKLPEGEIVLFDTNKVSLVNFTQHSVNGTIIRDQVIHDMIKTLFELAWEGSTLSD